MSPRVLTLSVERCPSWIRRFFVCPCLCLFALLGGVCLCVRLCERIVSDRLCTGAYYIRKQQRRAAHGTPPGPGKRSITLSRT
eukprot:scaffold25232_cov84-Phaeocystis_antarctica.AAC.1